MCKQTKIIAVIIFVLFGIGCEIKNSYNDVIMVGVSPVVSSSGIFIAKEKGYFKELGLNVEITSFRSSGASMTVLLAKGDLDVGGGNLSTGLWNAINEGLNIKLVADKGHIEKGHSYIALIVRKDHIESRRFTDLSDLKGFKMALTSLGGVSQQIATERFLMKGGLKLSDVEFIKMSYSEMNVALASKSIDATVQLEPYVTKAELDGVAVKYAEVYEVYPDQQSAAIFYSSDFTYKHPRKAEKFMIAYLKGIRDYENAFMKNLERDTITAMLKKYIKINSNDVWGSMTPVGLNPNGFINKDALSKDLIWYKDHGYIKQAPNIEDVIDHSYVENALTVVGKY